ncbi:hypothetical protein GCM10022397_20820 [Flavivirga jejuensis]
MIGQTTHNINDPEDLTNLSLSAGDEVILANGTYSSDERIQFLGTGTSNNPITFKPETPGGVIFTGGLQMDIAGSYLVVDGFYWNGGYGASNFIQFRNGTTYAQNCTIKNCAINGLTVSPDDLESGTSVKHRWVVLYGNYNNVINCSFMNKSNAGATILVELEYNAEANRCTEVGHTISNNYFYKYDKIDTSLTNAGDSETIRVGTSEFQNVNCATTVSNNYFVEADGENEIITNKSDNNIYVNNTFRRCRGSLVLRHGSGATVDGNIFLGEDVDGTGGIRIVDSDHTITNNYIQDCITVVDQAKWNNGITFIGGGDSSVDNCTSTSVSNGYQISQDIVVSNNTIVNTNAPLFYNTDKGSTNVTGTCSNNLIYFDQGASNLTDIISGDTTSSYSSMGTALSYSGNVYNVASLGTTSSEAVNGFSVASLNASNNGEIYNISGASGKGANLNGYEPTTDSMVGNGIGACFIGAEGNNLTDCNGSTPNYLTTNSLSQFSANGGSQTITVSSNVSWTVSESSSWISVNTTSGSNNGTVSVTASANTATSTRSASITISGGNITRTVSVTQSGTTVTPSDNLAINGTASQSTTAYNGVASRAIDGNTNGSYSSGSVTHTSSITGSWWQVVLNSQTNIGDITIYNRTDSCCINRLSNFTVYVYDSSNNQVFSQTITEAPNSSVTVNAGGVFGNTIKIVNNLTSTPLSLAEVEVYEGEGSSTSCSSGTNLSLNATIVDFSTQENTTNTVLNIIDGNDTNRWSASGFPQYAVIDLGDSYSVNEVNLATYNDRDYQFTVEGSTTSANSGFSTLVDASNNTDDGPINETFSSQEARYVKLTITGANSYTGTWVSIADFEIICAGTSTAKTDTKKIVSNSPAVLEFKAYPNPFSNTINITTDTNDTIILKLVDLVGKTIKEKTINSNASLDNLDNLAKGLYFLQIINTNTQTIKVQKLIKK